MTRIDSREVMPGDTFVAVRGAARDGAAYVEAAIAAGAARVVSEDPPPTALPPGVEWVRVADSRAAAAHLACEDAGRPSENGLAVVAVTGTNGKTTVANLARRILSATGRPCALWSTIESDPNPPENAAPSPARNTTPGPVELQGFFSEALRRGCRAAAIEASSHALDQKRIDGTRLACAIFTNLTQDHLDYHRTMEAYGAAKARLFLDLEPRAAVVNSDDPFGAALAAKTRAAGTPTLTYGFSDGADLRIENLRLDPDGSEFSIVFSEIARDRLRKLGSAPCAPRLNVRTRLMGRHNALNAAAALGAALSLGTSPERAAEILADAPPVRGRLEPVRVPGRENAAFFVDYAHTPDALANVLRTLRELVRAPGRLTVVFGAGGDRDRTKRPLMAKACAANADALIVTSDNPRSEDPEAIIDDVLSGLSPRDMERAVAIADRRQAIRRAVEMADRPGDVVIVAGKGHEDYQIFADRTVHFDDREELLACSSRASSPQQPS